MYETEVVDVVDISILHEAQVFIPYDLLYSGGHLVREQTLPLTLVNELRQLYQTVWPHLGRATGKESNSSCGGTTVKGRLEKDWRMYLSGMPMGSHKKCGTTFCAKPVCE